MRNKREKPGKEQKITQPTTKLITTLDELNWTIFSIELLSIKCIQVQENKKTHNPISDFIKNF